MKTTVDLSASKLDSHELVALCTEKMAYAARDLAQFTQHGINADYIVSLAYKCEAFEEALENNPQVEEVREMEKDLRTALEKICKTGQKIWSQNATVYNDYVYQPVAMAS